MGSTTEFILWTEGRDGKQPEPILFIASDENPSEDWTQVDRAFAPEDTPAGAPVDAPVGGPVGGPVSSGMDAAPDAAPDAGPVSSFGPARIVASDGTGVSTPDAAPVDNRMRLLEADPRYREAMDRMQFGQWPEVRDLLAELQTDYPHERPGCAAQRGAVAGRSGHPLGNKIRGRRLTVGQRRFLRRNRARPPHRPGDRRLGFLQFLRSPVPPCGRHGECHPEHGGRSRPWFRARAMRKRYWSMNGFWCRT